MKKLLFFVTEDWYFVSHRLSLAKAAQAAGYQVFIVTRCQSFRALLTGSGFEVIDFETNRRGLNPVSLLVEVIRLVKVYKKIRPDLVHHVALRPVIVGACAARLIGLNKVVAALTGMGFLFTTDKRKEVVRAALQWMFPVLLNRGLLIVQNSDDRDLLIRAKIPLSRIRLIPGSGVDTNLYQPAITNRAAEEPLTIMFASRLLWDKGIREFIDAAKLLKNKTLRFVLVGEPDADNPTTVAIEEIESWVSLEIVEWWGHTNQMQLTLRQADIVCLPSYREGMPKILLEAMSCGLPCIATDVPGCRAAIRHQYNGLLVPPKDAKALAEALSLLANDCQLRAVMGQRGRLRALNEFEQTLIESATVDVYREL